MQHVTFTALRYALVLALGGAIGAWATHLDYSAKMAQVQADHANEAATIAETERAKTTAALDDLKRAQAQINELDTLNYEKLQAQRAEIDRLNACVRNGTCGLRINATCPAPRGGSAPGSGTPGVDDGEKPVLTPVAESAYFALRHGINEQENKLVMCQEYVGKLWDRVTKLQQPAK